MISPHPAEGRNDEPIEAAGLEPWFGFLFEAEVEVEFSFEGVGICL